MQQKKSKLWIGMWIALVILIIIGVLVSTLGGNGSFVFPLIMFIIAIVIVIQLNIIPKYYNEYRREAIEDLIRNYDTSILDPDENPFTGTEFMPVFPDLKIVSASFKDFNVIRVEGKPISICNVTIMELSQTMMSTHFHGTILKMETSHYETFYFKGEKQSSNHNDYDLNEEFEYDMEDYLESSTEPRYPELIQKLQEHFVPDITVVQTEGVLYIAVPKEIMIYHDMPMVRNTRNSGVLIHQDLDSVIESWKDFSTIKHILDQTAK